MKTRVLFAALLCLGVSACQTLPPMADVHLHYNWDQAELISAKDAAAKLHEQNVVLAVVFSAPSELARELVTAAGDGVIPFFSPYYDAGNRHTWFYDPAVLDKTRAALDSGYYRGIGEVHIVSSLGPRRTNKVFQGLLSLAEEYDVPVNLHTEASSYRFLLPICEGHPRLRFIWAHAGGVMGPKDVAALFARCDNVWVEFSARDPWHYGNLTDGQGKLLPGWVEVISQYPTRFMVGTDPVWNAQQVYRWYEADQGWDHYAQLNHYHRAWLQQLPEPLRQNLRLDNARAFFGVD